VEVRKTAKNVMPPCKSDQMVRACRHVIVTAVVLAFAGLLQAGCGSVPERFTPANPLSPAEVSHAEFDRALRASVHGGVVDYPALQADAGFHSFVARLDRVDPDSLRTHHERLAFWINAYNAFAIQGILDGLSPAPYIGWYRYFHLRCYAVGGQRLTLSDIEHKILRARFREPRIHFAIVCASTSCPELQPRAYHADLLDRQLDQAASAFINDPSRNRFDVRTKVAYLSKIFDWFQEDFSVAAGDVPRYVARYVNDPEIARDLAAMRYRVEYLEYDWSLNGIHPQEARHAGSP
jgi:hypothetical protein